MRCLRAPVHSVSTTSAADRTDAGLISRHHHPLASQSADEHRRRTEYELAAVRGRIAESCCGLAAHQAGDGAEDHNVRWSNADAHAAECCCRHSGHEHRGCARRDDRSANVRNRRHTRRHHRADVHISYARGRHSHGRVLSLRLVQERRAAQRRPDAVPASRRDAYARATRCSPSHPVGAGVRALV